MVCSGVIASGSTRNSIRDGPAKARQRSSAAANSLSCSTISPWPPKLRANAAKSGLCRRVPIVRPG